MIAGQGDWKDECVALNAVKLTDALIEELERTSEKEPVGPEQFTRIER